MCHAGQRLTVAVLLMLHAGVAARQLLAREVVDEGDAAVMRLPFPTAHEARPSN
jgi:hypothetical protein